jgi:DNA-binding NarL/FixJ family response regulator
MLLAPPSRTSWVLLFFIVILLLSPLVIFMHTKVDFTTLLIYAIISLSSFVAYTLWQWKQQVKLQNAEKQYSQEAVLVQEKQKQIFILQQELESCKEQHHRHIDRLQAEFAKAISQERNEMEAKWAQAVAEATRSSHWSLQKESEQWAQIILSGIQNGNMTIYNKAPHPVASTFSAENELVEKLKLKYQGLKEKDLYLCANINRGMTNKEIAQAQGVTVKAIEKQRKLLRAQLHIPEKTSIANFLKQL